jgi:hypothetical protein
VLSVLLSATARADFTCAEAVAYVNQSLKRAEQARVNNNAELAAYYLYTASQTTWRDPRTRDECEKNFNLNMAQVYLHAGRPDVALWYLQRTPLSEEEVQRRMGTWSLRVYDDLGFRRYASCASESDQVLTGPAWTVSWDVLAYALAPTASNCTTWPHHTEQREAQHYEVMPVEPTELHRPLPPFPMFEPKYHPMVQHDAPETSDCTAVPFAQFVTLASGVVGAIASYSVAATRAARDDSYGVANRAGTGVMISTGMVAAIIGMFRPESRLPSALSGLLFAGAGVAQGVHWSVDSEPARQLGIASSIAGAMFLGGGTARLMQHNARNACQVLIALE